MKPNFYKQYDNRWANYTLKRCNVGRNGCGPTSIANVVSALTHKKTTPKDVFKYMVNHGYIDPVNGSYWNGITATLKHYGIKKFQVTSSQSSARNALQKGHWLIGVVTYSRWTRGGHYITLYGIKNGKVLVSDSASASDYRQKQGTWNEYARAERMQWIDINPVDYQETKTVITYDCKVARLAIKRAKEKHPYKNGGNSWTNGIDCHHFTARIMRACGFEKIADRIIKPGFYKKFNTDAYLGKYLIQHKSLGLNKKKLLPGDIVLRKNLTVGGYHSAIYVGDGYVAEAVGSGTRVHKMNKLFTYAFRIPKVCKIIKTKEVVKKPKTSKTVTLYISDAKANIRKGRGGKYGVKAKLKRGTKLKLYSYKNGWYRIKSGKYKGYYIAEKTLSKYKPYISVFTTLTSMNVRDGYTTNGTRVLKVIDKGTKFKTSKKKGKWVYAPAYKGWVCIKDSTHVYLKEKK